MINAAEDLEKIKSKIFLKKVLHFPTRCYIIHRQQKIGRLAQLARAPA